MKKYIAIAVTALTLAFPVFSHAAEEMKEGEMMQSEEMMQMMEGMNQKLDKMMQMMEEMNGKMGMMEKGMMEKGEMMEEKQ